MYPFGDLPANLAAFCGELRREHGFRIGPGELRDAARALALVETSDEREVRHALRAILASDRRTADAFDPAFDAFFYPGPEGIAQTGLPALGSRGGRPGRGTPSGARRPADGVDDDAPALDTHGESGGTALDLDEDAADAADDAARVAGSRYSPLEAGGHGLVRIRPVSAEWRAAARAFVHRLRLGLSRRWRPGPTGRRIDMRRTWRASLQLGGEALVIRRLTRRRRAPRFVVLIDGSRSMGPTDLAALDLVVAIASVTSRVHAFTFSTSLRRVTREVRKAAAGGSVDVRLTHDAWGGGTNIGASLRTFLQQYGERLVGPDTLVIVVSDGLDVGEPLVLREAMRELHRRSAGVTWLNPLLDTPGYEPTSRGMATARPFITTFAGAPSARGLARLARIVRTR